MDLTADEIKASLVDKAKDESAKNTEYYARQSLTFGIILLLIMFTMLVLAGGAPGEAYYIPSASNGAEYVGIEYRVQIELPDLVFPIEGLK